jgi:mannose/fructose/N-acetylgalactosamine-specific phosphotransferase system component IIC
MEMKQRNDQDEEELLRERYAIFIIGLVIGAIVGMATGLIIGGKLSLMVS